MQDRTRRLRHLMSEHRLSARDVAPLVGVSPHTVFNWLCPAGPEVPRHRLDLLELRLKLGEGVPA